MHLAHTHFRQLKTNRFKFTTRGCLGTAIASILGIATPALANHEIILDGNAEDWNMLAPLATANGQSVNSLKAHYDDNYLYILIEGSGLGPHYDLLLNTDNNSSTGHQSTTWSPSGMDYLVEDGGLYASAGTGWNWTALDPNAVSTAGNASTLEIRIAKSALVGMSNTLEIAFRDADSNWTTRSRLPLAGQQPVAYLMTPAVMLTIDGNASDWNAVPALSSTVGQSVAHLKAHHDDTYIYLAALGTGMGPNFGFFIDADNDPATGYQSPVWSTSGADYMVENGVLYRSTSNGWTWTAMDANVLQSAANPDVAEIRIERAALTGLADRIHVAFRDIDPHWATRSRLPVTGELPAYVLNVTSPPPPPQDPPPAPPPGTDTPFIQSLSEPARQGALIEIRGAGFGVKSPAKPLYWADFETGIQPTSLGRRTQWDTINPHMELSSAIPLANSTQSLRGDMGMDYVGTGAWSTPHVGLANHPAERLYIFMKRYYAVDMSTFGNHKSWRFWKNRGQPNYTNWYMGYHNNNVSMAFAERTENRSSRWYGHTVATFTWMTQEVEYQVNNMDVADGIARQTVDGVRLTDLPSNTNQYRDDDFTFRNSTYPDMYDLFYIQDDISNETRIIPNRWVYYDDIYVDDSWARVVVCDTPTWEACKRREIQIPESWTDTQIRLTINQGTFDSLSGKYLYVLNPAGKVNANGFRL